jgi:hypothetical protein
MSDRASKAVIEASLPGEPRMYNTRSKRSGDPLITLYYRDYSGARKKGRRRVNSISLRQRRKPSKSI